MAIAQESFPALGTTAVVAVSDPPVLRTARAAVEEVIARVDQACSRFRDDSEIAALARARGQALVVSPLLFDAVGAALRAAALTDGDVDPTLGTAMRALGYDRDFDALAERGPARVRVALVPGWRAVTLNRQARTIRVPEGVELDLGATAKGLAADLAAAAAGEVTRAGVLVSLGGDMAMTGEAPPEGWRIRVTDDHRSGAEAPGQWIGLPSGGLATSSTQVRRWETDAGVAHHLLDPATGKSVDGPWRTASVCAASCLDANIASTAAMVRGDRAPAWLESLGLPSRLVSRDGRVLHLAGWPTDRDDLPLWEPVVGASL